MFNIRPSAVAGAFYPSSKEELRKSVNYFLIKSAKTASKINLTGKQIHGLVVPHAGYIYSAVVAGAGYNLFKTKTINPKPKILLLGPSHNALFEGLATTSFSQWETPLGLVPVDKMTQELISKNPELIIVSDEAHQKEHCLEVQLPFLQQIFPDFSIIPLLTGDGDPKLFADILNSVVPEIDFILVSSDLSHYFPYQKAAELDNRTNKFITAMDILNFIEQGEACGKQGILTILHLAKKNNWQIKLVDYQNSGDTGGDKSRVVGYSSFVYY